MSPETAFADPEDFRYLCRKHGAPANLITPPIPCPDCWAIYWYRWDMDRHQQPRPDVAENLNARLAAGTVLVEEAT